MTLPNSVVAGQAGHVTDHNTIKTLLDSKLDRSVPVDQGVDFLTRANAYTMFTATHTADGQRDDVLKIGYNLAKTPGHAFGAKVDAADVAWQIDLENHYRASSGAPNYSEYNLDWWSTAATGNAKRRPFSVLINRDTLLTQVFQAAEVHQWQNSNGSRVVMELKGNQGRLGIGVSAGVVAHLRANTAIDGSQNQQLVLGTDGAGLHNGLIGSNVDNFTADPIAWGIFGGANDYLTGITNSVGIITAGSVPAITFRRAATLASPGVREMLRLDTVDPTAGNTSVFLCYHNGTAIVTQCVAVGAADSGGTGRKVLTVPN